MPSRVRGRRVVWGACCVLLAACRSSAGGAPAPGEAVLTWRGERVHELDLASPTAVESLPAALAEPERSRFVQIELTEISNPGRTPIALEVRHRPVSGAESLLGIFSPFPSDNPGRFIVPTGGRLVPGGAIAVTLVLLPEAPRDDDLRVKLRISLRER
jgi:hypothetical protein